MQPQLPRPSRRDLATLISLLSLLVLVQLLPDLGLVDFHREEARRVLPAREMLSSGDFVVPTIWGAPYLSKPPGYFWILAGAFELAGGVSEYAARMTSVLSVLLTSLCVGWVGLRLHGLLTGLLGGALFVLAQETLNKGRLAEIEPALTLFVFLAVALWWLGRERSWGVSLLSGLALAAALSCKGPAALLFFVAPAAALALVRRQPSFVLSPRFLVPLLLGCALAGSWALALFDTIGYEKTLEHWAGQVSGQGGKTIPQYSRERASFLLGSLFAFAPASLLLLLAWGTRDWRRVLLDGPFAFSLWTALVGWLFFLVFPGTNVRYAYPLLPFLALCAGQLLAEVLADRAEARDRGRRERRARGLAVRGGRRAAVVFAGLFVPLGEIEVDLTGAVLGAVLLATCIWDLRTAQPHSRLMLALLLMPLLIGQLLRSQAGPADARRHSRAPNAAAFEAKIPEGGRVDVAFWQNFNTLLYIDRELHFEPDWRALVGERWLLLTGEQFAQLERDPDRAPWRFELLERRTLWDSECVLLHVLPSA